MLAITTTQRTGHPCSETPLPRTMGTFDLKPSVGSYGNIWLHGAASRSSADFVSQMSPCPDTGPSGGVGGKGQGRRWRAGGC